MKLFAIAGALVCAAASTAFAQATVCEKPRQMEGFKTCADVEKAEAEGAFVLYSTDPEAGQAKLVAAFNKAFPKIKTNYFRLQAGASWVNQAYRLRSLFQSKVNEHIPAALQLTEGDFGRDMHAFQAPDVTGDDGTYAFVKPELGADLLFGLQLAKFLRMGVFVRVGLGAGRDLAQLCRERFGSRVSLVLWALAEIAICATDLAELIGTAIALQLLFGIPLLIGVVVTALDALLILWLQRKGMRWLEALIIALISLVTVCFAIEIVISRPDVGAVLAAYFQLLVARSASNNAGSKGFSDLNGRQAHPASRAKN